MGKRRFQDPKPFREGNWWWITPRKDEFVRGKLQRVRSRVKVCEAKIPEREARKMLPDDPPLAIGSDYSGAEANRLTISCPLPNTD